MKRLKELFDCEYNTQINGIKINSKEVTKGDLFVCTKGVKTDRHDFIDDAIKNGAAALVVSKDVDVNIPCIKVSDTNKVLPIICSKFYDNPEKKLKIIGVTGTDGKTSVSTIIQTLIGKDKCGYIGTNGRCCSLFNKEINNTTPDADKLYEYFSDFVDAGCKYVVMEASSEAFFRGRLQNLEFDCSIITNITWEHLNIHGTMENYVNCKGMLFEQTKKDAFSILNIDDEYFEKIKSKCNDKVLTYGKNDLSTLQIKDFKLNPNNTLISLKYNDENIEFLSPLLGDFNVYNICAALLACFSLGFKFSDIKDNIKKINISGRLDMIDLGQNYYVMVDYAHTPNGIEKLLDFVHTLDIKRSIVVIGSAGERDYVKRPVMGSVILNNANYAIFTYEDPRSEDPLDIINDLLKDSKDKSNYEIIVDRAQAIKKAISIAREKDMVLILAKGNETYEKLKDKTIYFNDIEEAKKCIQEREGINV